jgi:tRNA (guanine-N7-)-methyltransferase
MSRSKQDRFRENALRENVIEPGKPVYDSIKGNWKNTQFKNPNPVVLELACGKGDYTIGLARLFTDINFVGVDIKGSRIWTGSRIAESEGLKNVAFLRTEIHKLENFFCENEADEIWITFPDPRPRERDIRRRLTCPRYLEIYKKIIKPGGWIYLKTDNDQLYHYSLKTINSLGWAIDISFTDDLYQSGLASDHFGLQTIYEKRFLEQGIKIKYLKFRVNK